MIPHFSKIHNFFKLNGRNHYTKEDLFYVAYSYIKEGISYEKEIGMFLLDWLDDKKTIFVETSGTTGIPKKIEVEKQAMVESAIATGNFFELEPGNSALNCLPCRFIAGKMMLVRAMILGLHLDIVSPNGNPIRKIEKVYDFAAMVPMQVEKAFKDKNFKLIKTLIIGGVKPSKKLVKTLKEKKETTVYETYGMTETLTHIAAKPIHEETFKALPGVIFSTDDRNCLCIQVERISDTEIKTNDVVSIVSPTEFKWLGRVDNVINSGGIKLYPEEIEEKLQTAIENRFFIYSEPNEQLGEQVVLVIESDKEQQEPAFELLDSYEKPKKCYFIAEFEETASGKVNRKKTFEKIKAEV